MPEIFVKKTKELQTKRVQLEQLIQQRTQELQALGNTYQQLIGQLQLLDLLEKEEKEKKAE